MAVMVEMQNTGDPTLQRDVVASIEHALACRPGDWRVSIIGSQADDKWEMKITGPNAFERSYTLEGSSGEHSRERRACGPRPRRDSSIFAFDSPSKHKQTC
jgi:hypothetical protein